MPPPSRRQKKTGLRHHETTLQTLRYVTCLASALASCYYLVRLIAAGGNILVCVSIAYIAYPVPWARKEAWRKRCFKKIKASGKMLWNCRKNVQNLCALVYDTTISMFAKAECTSDEKYSSSQHIDKERQCATETN